MCAENCLRLSGLIAAIRLLWSPLYWLRCLCPVLWPLHIITYINIYISSKSSNQGRSYEANTEIQHFQQTINEFYDQYLCPPVCRMHLSETSFDLDSMISLVSEWLCTWKRESAMSEITLHRRIVYCWGLTHPSFTVSRTESKSLFLQMLAWLWFARYDPVWVILIICLWPNWMAFLKCPRTEFPRSDSVLGLACITFLILVSKHGA